jgi:16S rRNA processing protein RimM
VSRDPLKAVEAAAPASEPVVMGYIAGIFGMRGWLKVHSYTRPRDQLLRYRVWNLGRPGAWQTLRVIDHRVRGTGLVVALEGISCREQAETLTRQQVAVRRTEFPDLGPGSYYWADLIGLAVRTREGQGLGVVKRLVEAGDHDVMVIRGEREYLVPFVSGHYVLEVDKVSGCIVVDWHADD